MVMKVKVSISDYKSKDMERLEAFMKGAKSAYVTIGIHSDAGEYPGGPDVVEVALWQEFGTETIPQRSFIRSVIDGEDFGSKINQWRDEAIEKILFQNWTLDKALDYVGFKVQVLIQNKIKSNTPPPYGTGKGPNPPERVAALQKAKRAKGFPVRTLIETGLLLRSVGYKVVVQ